MKNRTKLILVKLGEESGELTQIAMKTLQYGLESDDCGSPPKKNRKLLTEEAGDVLACIYRLVDLGALDWTEVYLRANEKRRKHKEQGR